MPVNQGDYQGHPAESDGVGGLRSATFAAMNVYSGYRYRRNRVFGNTDTRVSFAHAGCMFQAPSNRKQFVVTCKLCHRDVPSGAKEFPFKSIAVTCSLCGEQRQYLPSEITFGRPHQPEAKRA